MNDTQYQLFVQRGPEPGKVYPLNSVSMTIGRDPMVEIPITDPEVSRQHVRLTGTLSGYKIQDLGSTNGTYVDGVRLGGEAVELAVGQIITMGEGVVLQFQGVPVGQDEMATILDGRFSSPDVEKDEELETPIGPSEPYSTEGDGDILIAGPVFQSEPIQDVPLIENSDDSFSDEMPLVGGEVALSESFQEDLYQQQENNFHDGVESNADSPQKAGEPVIIPHKGESRGDEQSGVERNKRRTPAIIVSILLLILCCCCSFILFIYYYGGDWVLRQMGFLP